MSTLRHFFSRLCAAFRVPLSDFKSSPTKSSPLTCSSGCDSMLIVVVGLESWEREWRGEGRRDGRGEGRGCYLFFVCRPYVTRIQYTLDKVPQNCNDSFSSGSILTTSQQDGDNKDSLNELPFASQRTWMRSHSVHTLASWPRVKQ